MGLRCSAVILCTLSGALGLAALPAAAQTSKLNHVPPARAPCSVLSGHPCHPSFCSAFHRGPCFTYDWPAFGQTLRLTITSSDDDRSASKDAADGDKSADNGDKKDADRVRADAEEHQLDTIGDMFAALRGCWVPPPKDEARHGMEYTIRFSFKRDGEMIGPPRMTYASHDAPADVRDVYRGAIDAALKRCTPLHFSEGMGDAIAGRPIAVRFVDERTIDKDSAK
jgi:hypothetical protein